MSFTALVVCLFVLPCQALGDVREETLYVKTGTDLLLDVQNPVTLNENDEMFWALNSTVRIVKLTHTNTVVPFGIYVGRAEVFPKNQSLLLKNVKMTDSGEYWAVFSGDRDKVLAQYQVTVLDPVSDVKLEVKQCSSDRSDLTVTCTTLDGLLSSTFICENTTCSHEGGEKNISPGASMKVYLQSGFVTCSHSNQVSYSKDTGMIALLCLRKEDKDPGNSAPKDDSKASSNFLYFIFGSACVVAVVLCYRCWRQCRMRNVLWCVEAGTDLQLNVGHAVHLNQNDELFWKFQREVNVVKLTQTSGPVYHPNYAGRAEFSPQDQWLLLKNVQKTDSGEYWAVFSGDTDRVLVKYQVKVQRRKPTCEALDEEMNQFNPQAQAAP